jgi:acyl-CoA thioesterase I
VHEKDLFRGSGARYFASDQPAILPRISPLFRLASDSVHMSRMAFHFAGGDAFFAGLLLILTAVLPSISGGKRRLVRLRALLAVVGLIVVTFSGTPLPDWAYWGSGFTIFVWLFLFVRPRPDLEESGTEPIVDPPDEENFEDFDESELDEEIVEEYPPPDTPRSLRMTSIAVGIIGFLMFAWEIKFRGTPHLGETRHSELVVIGDSISAGMLGPEKETTWPRRFEKSFHVPVMDLSREGATAKSALKQAANVPDTATLVLVEIGGNDILGPTSAADFAMHLEALLTTLVREGRQVVMLELPMPPLYNRFGQAQRELAARFDVALISKRDFAAVFATKGATLDGLHLSEEGHQQLADLIWRHLSWNLTPPDKDIE